MEKINRCCLILFFCLHFCASGCASSEQVTREEVSGRSIFYIINKINIDNPVNVRIFFSDKYNDFYTTRETAIELYEKTISPHEFIYRNDVYLAGSNFMVFESKEISKFGIKSLPHRTDKLVSGNGRIIIDKIDGTCFLLTIQNYEFYKFHERIVHNYRLQLKKNEELVKVVYPAECKK